MEVRKNKERHEDSSFRMRASRGMRLRKKQLRTRIILANTAVALLVIMCILVVKLVSLNKSDKTKGTGENSVETSVDAGAGSPPADTAQASAVPASEKVKGKDRWIRKDLDPDKPMIALTFDDGPYAPVTNKLLDVAEKYDVRFTFFVVGNRVQQFKKALKREYKTGCQVASHTHDHQILTGLTPKQIKEQVNKANKAIKKIIGCSASALRPPGGGVNDKVRKYVKLPMICWDVDTEDWKSRNPTKILQRCKSISDGNIILMHDLYPTTAQAVTKLVPRLLKKGFQLVTIDELFYYKKIKLKKGHVYFNGK